MMMMNWLVLGDLDIKHLSVHEGWGRIWMAMPRKNHQQGIDTLPTMEFKETEA